MADKQNKGILLRLPNSVREQARERALADGTSLNFFITQAIAEKIERMRQLKPEKASGTTREENGEKERKGEAAVE